MVNYILNLWPRISILLRRKFHFQEWLIVGCLEGFRMGTIIYMAALTIIDQHTKQLLSMVPVDSNACGILHCLIMPYIILNLILTIPSILNAGFDQIFNLYNERVYRTADVLDTFIYRLGIVDAQYDLSCHRLG